MKITKLMLSGLVVVLAVATVWDGIAELVDFAKAYSAPAEQCFAGSLNYQNSWFQ